MQRDIDLMHKILFALEGKRSGVLPNSLEIDGYTRTAVNYHLELLADSELVAREYHNGRLNHFRLTNEGHKLIEALRAPVVVDTPGKRVKETSKDVIITVLKVALDKGVELAFAELRRLTGLP